MAALTWHGSGEKKFETGVDKVVLYPIATSGTTTSDYDTGVAWNGVTAINENPGGADITDLYADNEKYASLQAAETFGFTIEAYTYPDAWNACDGSQEATVTVSEVVTNLGAYLGQQGRKAFGLCYRTKVGSDTVPDPSGTSAPYKLHLIYNSVAQPSSRGYTTINNNPDAISFSWDAQSTPVACTGHKSVCTITIDSAKANATKLAALEALLYGDANGSATLPKPDVVLSTLTPST